MAGMILRRSFAAIPTLFLIVTLAFFLMRAAPGGPFDLERPLDPRVIENLKRVYGLDRSLFEQYLTFLWSLTQGDLGPSLSVRDFSVTELLVQGLPLSMLIGGSALALSLLFGLALGVVSAEQRGRCLDHIIEGFATLSLVVPGFVIAPLLQIVFALSFKLVPVAGFEEGSMRHLILPVIALALPQAAIIARLTRAAMIETLNAPHIRTLRSLGLPPYHISLHALRASLLPVVSYLGPAAAALLTGSVVIETIFAIPGIGRHFVDAALNRDYTLVMGTVILVAAMILAFNLLADVLYVVLDPRIEAET